MKVKVNLGCGPKPFKGWINIDKSWNTVLYKVPLLKKVILKTLSVLNCVNNAILQYVVEYPKDIDIRKCDVTKGLTFKDSTVDCIYTNNMLEHLTEEEFMFVLNDCYRVLKEGGIFRLVVPDLFQHVAKYIKDKDADGFMHRIMLHGIGDERPLFVRLLSNHHLWMYDFQSISIRLKECDFTDIRECKFGIGSIPDIHIIEAEEYHPTSVYVEAIK